MQTTSNQFLGKPVTKLGWWSIGLIVAMPILFFIGTSFTNSLYKSVPAGDTILEDIAARPALALTMLAGMTAGILTFITGLVAIVPSLSEFGEFRLYWESVFTTPISEQLDLRLALTDKYDSGAPAGVENNDFQAVLGIQIRLTKKKAA